MGFTGILEGFLGAHLGFRGEFVPVWVDVFWGVLAADPGCGELGMAAGETGFFAAWGRIRSEGRSYPGLCRGRWWRGRWLGCGIGGTARGLRIRGCFLLSAWSGVPGVELAFERGLRWCCRGDNSEYKCAPIGGNFGKGGWRGRLGERVSSMWRWTAVKTRDDDLEGDGKMGMSSYSWTFLLKRTEKMRCFWREMGGKWRVFGVVWMVQGNRAGGLAVGEEQGGAASFGGGLAVGRWGFVVSDPWSRWNCAMDGAPGFRGCGRISRRPPGAPRLWWLGLLLPGPRALAGKLLEIY